MADFQLLEFPLLFKEGWPGMLISGYFIATNRPAGVVDCFDGILFRRQHGIGNYIVDFCCPSEKLVIELDGDQHGDYEQIEKDKKRNKYLEELAKSTTPAGDKAL
jgi:hypothetical protein